MQIKKAMKTILVGLVGIIIGVVVMQIGLPIVKYFGSPHVTLINATGDSISNVTISLGPAKRQVPDLKDGQSVTVQITGEFSETSTHVSWVDSVGKHEEMAGDYMENSGGYHSKVLLTPDRKAKAIYEVTEEWLIENKTNNAMQPDARTSRP